MTFIFIQTPCKKDMSEKKGEQTYGIPYLAYPIYRCFIYPWSTILYSSCPPSGQVPILCEIQNILV